MDVIGLHQKMGGIVIRPCSLNKIGQIYPSKRNRDCDLTTLHFVLASSSLLPLCRDLASSSLLGRHPGSGKWHVSLFLSRSNVLSLSLGGLSRLSLSLLFTLLISPFLASILNEEDAKVFAGLSDRSLFNFPDDPVRLNQAAIRRSAFLVLPVTVPFLPVI